VPLFEEERRSPSSGTPSQSERHPFDKRGLLEGDLVVPLVETSVIIEPIQHEDSGVARGSVALFTA
jgi:hypothetical protein